MPQVILSHFNLDFDGLASMVAAKKLWPEAILVHPGRLKPAVQEFMSLHKDVIPLSRANAINPENVGLAVVVDTNSPIRLGEGKNIIGLATPVVVIDHHPVSSEGFSHSQTRVDRVGATTTIMVEELRERRVPINPFEATILALGIYEDTGFFTNAGTTSRDIMAAAFLLDQGANLVVVRDFLQQPLNGELQDLFYELVANAKEKRINGINVVFTGARRKKPIPGVSVLADKLGETIGCPVVFLVIEMGKRVQVVARSSVVNADVNVILNNFNGAGHAGAASANIRGMSVEEVMERLEQVCTVLIVPGITAKQIMSFPVKTIRPDTTIEEAYQIMLRYGHTGLPVTESAILVGIISRRDVDKAIHHGLGHAPVKGYMSSQVLAIGPDTGVDEIRDLMIEHDIGRLPVLENGRVIGIVSRSNMLHLIHGEHYPRQFRTMYQITCPMACPLDPGRLLQTRLSTHQYHYLRIIGRLAKELQVNVFLVGGAVRDLFLGVSVTDMDMVVVDGDAVDLATKFSAMAGGKIKLYPSFGTATVLLLEGEEIDFATSRKEYYAYPAALPEVETAGLRDDLYRRDFTINAMAMDLSPDRFGRLIDYFCGHKDLEAGLIRVLHNLSFIEDPTRILRAIRFENRYGFSMEAQTEYLAADPAAHKALQNLSGARLWRELSHLLSEPHLVGNLQRLHSFGLLQYLWPELNISPEWWEALSAVPEVIDRYQGETPTPAVQREMVALGVLLAEIPDVYRECKRLELSRSQTEAVTAIPPAYIQGNNKGNISSPGSIHRWAHCYGLETLLAVAALLDEDRRGKVLDYLKARKDIPSLISGEELRHLGLKPGPVFGKIIFELACAQLDGMVQDRGAALSFARRLAAEIKDP